MPPLLHTPDQITDRPLVALRVMLVPTAKEAEPAATVPLVTKLSAVARTSGTARAANGVTVAVPEMPPTVIVAPVQPAGKRAGSMLMRLTRVLVPSVRASPTAGKPGRLGFSPPTRASVARRTAPMHPPPEQLSPLVAALPSLHASALLRCPQPTAGGVQKSVVHTLASSPVFGAPTHAPRVQVSPTVQTLASLQGPVVKFTRAQVPAPLQALSTHTSGAPQGWPRGSDMQSGEQQSPATRLPSSHCSPRSSTPFPQMWAILPMMVLNRLFCCPPTGNPGPSTRTKF